MSKKTKTQRKSRFRTRESRTGHAEFFFVGRGEIIPLFGGIDAILFFKRVTKISSHYTEKKERRYGVPSASSSAKREARNIFVFKTSKRPISPPKRAECHFLDQRCT